ncbi:MAG: hypothetical protein COB42_06785 [Sulfurimonas sp.]|nr:MAG: hypothetical protein COB42_06785 [Sulfurimonas sp.]
MATTLLERLDFFNVSMMREKPPPLHFYTLILSHIHAFWLSNLKVARILKKKHSQLKKKVLK